MPCSVSARDNFSVSASAGRNYPWGLGADDFQTKMLVMFAVIFVDSAHHDAIGARFEIGGKARDPDVRAQLHSGPRFLGGLVASEHFLDKRIRPALALHPHRRPLADPVLDGGARAAVEKVDDHVGGAGLVLGDRRAEHQAHSGIVVLIKIAIEDDTHLPSLGLL